MKKLKTVLLFLFYNPPILLTKYSMNEYEIITDPQVIEEAFRQDQEAEDAPVPDKVQDILTNTV